LPQKRPSEPFQLGTEDGSTSGADERGGGKTATVEHFCEVTKMIAREKPRRWSAAGWCDQVDEMKVLRG